MTNKPINRQNQLLKVVIGLAFIAFVSGAVFSTSNVVAAGKQASTIGVQKVMFKTKGKRGARVFSGTPAQVRQQLKRFLISSKVSRSGQAKTLNRFNKIIRKWNLRVVKIDASNKTGNPQRSGYSLSAASPL